MTGKWERVFSAGTATAQKVFLLQHGSVFATAINDFTKLPLANGIGAKVTKVVVTSPTKATVTYDIVSGSSTLLGGQTGTAGNHGGVWKGGAARLCAPLELPTRGSAPAACRS